MPVIEFKNIAKYFGKLRANDDISFSIEENSVHCILGENGAGKSTLMKILYGVYQPDSGLLASLIVFFLILMFIQQKIFL